MKIPRPTPGALKSGNLTAMDAGKVAELERGGFLVPADVDEKAVARDRYVQSKENSTLLAITIAHGAGRELIYVPPCVRSSHEPLDRVAMIAIASATRPP